MSESVADKYRAERDAHRERLAQLQGKINDWRERWRDEQRQRLALEA